MTLVLSENLARRIEQSEIEALVSRLTAVKKIEGNPMDVEIKKFGNATAFSVKNIPGPSFNTVKGIGEKDVEYVDDILNFYNEREIPVRFEITPADASYELLKYLSSKGYFQCDFHTALYGSSFNEAVRKPESESPVSIRRLEQNEFDIFGEIYTKGFSMPSFLMDGIAQNNEVLHKNDRWTFYLASVESKPAGIGVLFKYDGVGTLAASTTIPELRNKGVQSALLIKRINHARQLDCNIVVGQARYGSVSQNNMERLGMKVAYTKSIWVKK